MNEPSSSNQRPWWARQTPSAETAPPRYQAVAYYRHSAQDRQENSVAIQQEQVQQWARANHVEIIHEFADRGKSGLTAEGRPGFMDMMEEWVKKRQDFQFVLCLDVSRWGRFQDIDLSATYSAECKRHGKEVIYTRIGKPKEDDPFYSVYIQFERFRSAQQVKELSEKVFRGCMKIAQQGYWAGGKPPYAFARLLLDEARKPLHILAPGQRKGIQNQRVTLAWGEEQQVQTIQRIFSEYTQRHRTLADIAGGLNGDNIFSPGGRQWNDGKVRRILVNELYTGTMVYNKTTKKLKTPSKRNPSESWVRTGKAFEPMVEEAVFLEARRLLQEAARHFTPQFMIEQLERIIEEHQLLRTTIVRADERAPSPSTYAKYFTSLDGAYQRVFQSAVADVRMEVETLLRSVVEHVEPYDDFLVVNRKFTVLIQPSVPVPHGYHQYWYFRPDKRQAVDITLGVPVSGPEGPQILGFLALPRLLVEDRGIRVFGSSEARLDMYGHTGLEMISTLARS